MCIRPVLTPVWLLSVVGCQDAATWYPVPVGGPIWGTVVCAGIHSGIGWHFSLWYAAQQPANCLVGFRW